MTIDIRPIKTLDECKAFQDVERLVWGSDDESVMPIHVLVTISRNGGVLLGAYADDGPPEIGGMVGIVLGWYGVGVPPGEQTPRLKLCSHMAGVLPQWQRQHVGIQLKLAQRAETLAQGFTDWITWTYDPLLRANAVFNIHRLGATCQTYIRNIYGEMTDALNAGSGPSDRCQVDWRLNSERVRNRVAHYTAPGASAPPIAQERLAHLRVLPTHLRVLPTRPRGDFCAPVDVAPIFDGAPLAVPLPDDILTIRRRDPDLALEWRFYVRATLEQAFAAGYTIVDCLHVAQADWCYILSPAP
jgi:predicted GNAT superfamily acetyltransferase